MSAHFVLCLRDPPTAISDFIAEFTREARDGYDELRELSEICLIGCGFGFTLYVGGKSGSGLGNSSRSNSSCMGALSIVAWNVRLGAFCIVFFKSFLNSLFICDIRDLVTVVMLIVGLAVVGARVVT